MKYVVDSKKMKEIDKYTIDVIKIPSLVLMERAALKIVAQVNAIYKKGRSYTCGMRSR